MKLKYVLLLLPFVALCSPLHAALSVVAAGDSLANGFGKGRLSETLHNHALLEFGGTSALSGRKAQQFLDQGGVTNTLALSPDVVALMLGTNDAAQAHASDSWFADYQAGIRGVFDAFEAADSPPILIVMTPPPVVEPFARRDTTNPAVDQIRDFLITEAPARGHVLLDIHSEITALPDWESYYHTDGIHFWANDAAGYYWMAERIRDTAVTVPEPSWLAGILGLAIVLRRKR